jgi:hypothetical protein
MVAFGHKHNGRGFAVEPLLRNRVLFHRDGGGRVRKIHGQRVALRGGWKHFSIHSRPELLRLPPDFAQRQRVDQRTSQDSFELLRLLLLDAMERGLSVPRRTSLANCSGEASTLTEHITSEVH